MVDISLILFILKLREVNELFCVFDDLQLVRKLLVTFILKVSISFAINSVGASAEQA